MIGGTFPAPRGPLNLYDFVSDADRAVLLDRGMLPWWSHPKLTIRFFRPLTSAMVWGEHRLLGNDPGVLHAHSFAWWIAAVLAARTFFRQRLRPRVAAIATVIFALAPCHTLPLAWLANREALVSITFGTLALTAYSKHRDRSDLKQAAFALLLFAISFSAGEYSLCFGGYVLAIELFAGERSLLDRAKGIAIFAAPALVYLGVRSSLHYGTFGSGFYSDPTSEPVAFLSTAPRRLATLLADAWFSLDTETLSNTQVWRLLVLVVAAAALFYVPIKRTFASLEPAERRTASWLLLGSLFALLPVLAVVPSPRVCGASMLGIATCVALLLDHVWFSPPHARRGAPELTGTVAVLLGFFHLVHGPVTAWLVARAYHKSADEFASFASSLHERFPDTSVADVVLLRGMGGSFFMQFAIDPHGSPPRRWRLLAQTGHTLVQRTGPRELELTVNENAALFPSGHGNLYRSERSEVHVGDTFDVPGMRATILEMGNRGPRSARFVFDEDFDQIGFLTEKYRGFPEATVPAIGFGAPFDP